MAGDIVCIEVGSIKLWMLFATVDNTSGDGLSRFMVVLKDRVNELFPLLFFVPPQREQPTPTPDALPMGSQADGPPHSAPFD